MLDIYPKIRVYIKNSTIVNSSWLKVPSRSTTIDLPTFEEENNVYR